MQVGESSFQKFVNQKLVNQVLNLVNLVNKILAKTLVGEMSLLWPPKTTTELKHLEIKIIKIETIKT